MKAVLSPKEMKRIDELTMRYQKINSFQLMKRVANGMCEEILRRFPSPKRVLILCGPGNNGGDGYCLAEALRKKRFDVDVLEVYAPASSDAKRARKSLRRKPIQEPRLSSYEMIVDAVFGANGKAKLEPSIAKLFREIRKSRSYKIALDVPSGVDSGTGKAHPDSFYADLCLCVAYPKWGFLYEEVAEFLGEIVYVGGPFESPRHAKVNALELKDFQFATEKRTKHKSGHCAIVAGSTHTPGAAFLCAEAAHRTGVGYVSLFFAKKSALKIQLRNASFLFPHQWTWRDLNKATAIVVGPGGSPRSLKNLEKLHVPQVIDADALLTAWKLKASPMRIFTPHPGEAARLLRVKINEIQRDRLQSLERLSRVSQQAVYLKGAPGILAIPSAESGENQKYYVNLSINPSLARAGSGDILSGLLGGFLSQSKSFQEGVLSALIFQMAISQLLLGKRGAIASDQLEVFSQAFELLSRAS